MLKLKKLTAAAMSAAMLITGAAQTCFAAGAESSGLSEELIFGGSISGKWVEAHITVDEVICDNINYKQYKKKYLEKAPVIENGGEYTVRVPEWAYYKFGVGDSAVLNLTYDFTDRKAPYICAFDQVQHYSFGSAGRRTDVFFKLFCLKNDKVMIDETFDFFGLDWDSLESGEECYDKQNRVYGMFGNYNRLDESTGEYVFRDGMSYNELKKLIELFDSSHKARLEALKNQPEDEECGESNNSIRDNYYFSGKLWAKVTFGEIAAPPSAASISGWQTVSGKTYYKQNGKSLTGWQTIDGKRYYFNKDGSLVTKSTVIGGKRYKISSDGVCKGEFSGWTKSSKGKRYWKNGVLQKDRWIKMKSGKTYYAGSDGYMLTGWAEVAKDGGKYSYFDENGVWDGKTYNEKPEEAAAENSGASAEPAEVGINVPLSLISGEKGYEVSSEDIEKLRAEVKKAYPSFEPEKYKSKQNIFHQESRTGFVSFVYCIDGTVTVNKSYMVEISEGIAKTVYGDIRSDFKLTADEEERILKAARSFKPTLAEKKKDFLKDKQIESNTVEFHYDVETKKLTCTEAIFYLDEVDEVILDFIKETEIKLQ